MVDAHIKIRNNIQLYYMPKTRKLLPKLRKINYANKKHHYRIKDKFSKRKLAIHEGVNMESKKTGKTKKKAAIAKKGRFNILRIYRKNKKVNECEIITHDMRYMDKKYGLGKTKNICGKKGKIQSGGNDDEDIEHREHKVPTPTLQQATDEARWRAGINRLGRNATLERWVRRNDPRFAHLREEPLVAKKTQDGGKYTRKKRKKRRRKAKTKKQFLYNPNNPKKSFDVYIDKNPSDTIPIKYTTVSDVKKTIKKLERLFKTKKYTHKRIWQVGMIMKVRLEAMLKHKKTKYPKAKKVRERFELANKYFKFLGKRSKENGFTRRKKLTFDF